MPKLLVLSGPSGVGKTTLVAEVLRRRPGVRLSVSVTTRPPRPGETEEGKYRFVGEEEFDSLLHEGAFLEFAGYAGHLYGTPHAPLDAWLAEGFDVLLEIEVKGARQVRHARPDAVTIFVEPPSWDELERRLRARATEGDAALDHRLAIAREELAAVGEFQYRVVNDDLEKAVAEVLRIMERA